MPKQRAVRSATTDNRVHRLGNDYTLEDLEEENDDILEGLEARGSTKDQEKTVKRNPRRR